MTMMYCRVFFIAAISRERPKSRLQTIRDALEEHIVGCPNCTTRAEEAAVYVDAVRAALIPVNLDLDA
jgi:hypothetical protein